MSHGWQAQNGGSKARTVSTLSMMLGGVALVLGFLITQQIRVVNFLNGTAQVREEKLLSHLLVGQDANNAQLAKKVMQLRHRYETRASAPAVGELKSQEQQAKLLADRTAVSGSGVVVVMHDATRPAFPGEPADLRLIHDQYVLRVIALLSSAGAKAIAINGQRFTAVTSIYCAGPTIRINGVPYASPFVVQAIGPSQALYEVLAQDPDISGWSQLVSIKFHSAKALQIAPYTAPVHFLYAKPVKIDG